MDSISKKTNFWERKVGYYEIKWKIENFSFAFRDGAASFETETIWLTGKMLTKWRLKLDVTFSDGLYHLILFVRMIPPRYFPRNRVWTNWIVWVRVYDHNDEEVQYFMQEFRHIFESGQSCRRIPISKLLSSFSPFKIDVFSFRFLVVYNDIYGEPNYGLKPVPLGLLSLSNDLRYKINCSPDLKLKNNKKEIGVHKTILYYRNEVLKRMIENDCVDGVIHLQNKGGNELDSVVNYLYSGDSKYFLHKPTFKKMELALFLNIKEITNWFVLDKLSIESKYEIVDFTHDWTITNFSSQPEVINLIIRATGVNSLPSPIKLSLYSHIFENREQFSFFVKDCTASLPRLVFMQVSIGKRMFSWINTTRLYGTVMHGYDFGSIPFASKDLIQSCLVDDTLRLRFQLRACWNAGWKTRIDAMLNIFPRIDVDFYKKLSLDMEHMLKEAKFSDFRLNIRDSEWMTHKCILIARSKFFDRRREKNAMTLKKIPPHIFDKFINYIYSGVLEICGVRDLTAIYDLANRHGMGILLRICTDRLKQMITIDSVTDIVDFADEQGVASLKHITLDYVKENASEISKDPVWKHLLTLNLSSRKRARRFLDVEGALEEKLKPIMKIE